MKNKKNIGLVLTIVGGLFLVFGLSYAFYNYVITGDQNTVLVTGDIYMNYTENNQISLTDAVPMTKDDALKLNDNVFNFTISGKNQSTKDIYYGISIVYGEEEATKTRLKDKDIDVYLTSGDDVLVNANRYKTLNDTRIWVEKINANTDTYTKDYSIRLWIDESVTVSDTGGDYTQEVWNNSYASFKVKVDGNLDKMNIPLGVDYQNSYYENGKTYFNVEISNYLNPSVAGISLSSADTMKVDITKTNDNISFSYTDSEQNSSDSELQSISQTYSFDSNKKVTMKVLVNTKDGIDLKTDISIKLTKNDNETYEILKYMHIRGPKNYCKNNGFTNFADCLLVSEQLSNNVEEAKKAIQDKGEADTSKTSEATGEIGLYKTVDNDGDTYYYRGAVENNNVKFAGFYWKIIRVNGDGSIRLIYNGTKPNSTGYDASSITGKGEAYNLKNVDATYVGYMYGDNFSKTPVKSTTPATYGNIAEGTKYYFAKAYTSDNETKTFKLKNADYVGTFTEWNANNKLAQGYKYTCKSTLADGTCQFLMEITNFLNSTNVQAYIWTYGSTSYENTTKDNVSSNAKTILENWYTNTLSIKNENGIIVTNYINEDATFCNDRSLSSQEGNGNGYATVPTTYYGAYDRNVNKHLPSLECPNSTDLFSASDASKGNRKLEKPIGLITADEIAYAGDVYTMKGEKNYLHIGIYFWSMSPFFFNANYVDADMFYITSADVFHVGAVSFNGPGLRAVINLKSDVLVKNGNGTMDDPYTVKLAN